MFYWSSNNGNRVASISIKVNHRNITPFLELSYNYGNEPVKYRVRFISQPSNLGIGEVWYFLCPYTHKKCRKLYLVDGYFLHRTSVRGMYDAQTESKYYRSLKNTFGRELKASKLIDKTYQKHFKKYYSGKPTRKYLIILKKLEKIGF